MFASSFLGRNIYIIPFRSDVKLLAYIRCPHSLGWTAGSTVSARLWELTVYSALSATVQNWQFTVFYRQLYRTGSLQCFIGNCTELTVYSVLSATVQNWQFTIFIGKCTELKFYSVLSATVQNWKFTVFYLQLYRTESLQGFICNCTELTV